MTPPAWRIIDTCCLLDLYAGWNGLEPLAQLEGEWYLCPATIKEARYIRDVDSAGETIKVSVDLKLSLEKRLIRNANANDEEFESFLQLVGRLGDGEAMSLAIAMHRRWVLATDDIKTAQMAKKTGVETTSTPDIIKAWSKLNDDNFESLKSVLRNIEKRAHFKPPRNSPHFRWWIENSSN